MMACVKVIQPLASIIAYGSWSVVLSLNALANGLWSILSCVTFGRMILKRHSIIIEGLSFLHAYLIILVGCYSNETAFRKILGVNHGRVFLSTELVDDNSWSVFVHRIERHL